MSRLRVMMSRVTIISTLTIHIVRIVLVMLMSHVMSGGLMPSSSLWWNSSTAASGQIGSGATSSRVPLM